MIEVNISKNYSRYPGGRFRKDGDFSGEDFREQMLKLKYMEAAAAGEKLQINFDGGYGYATSFLEEAFGGLVRDLQNKDIKNNLILISDEDKSVIDKVLSYIDDACKELR